jgi:glutamine---fructose-6-phosphate transaminase (isomerizing)
MTTLRTEILEQPNVLATLLERESAHAETLARGWRTRGVKYVLLAARGSSDNAARYGHYVFGVNNGLPVASAAPSIHTLYGGHLDLQGALVIAVSQSGESPDILSVVDEARRQGSPTLAITNSERSTLASRAEDVMLLHAGEEKSIAATKTYTTSLAALALLSSVWPGAPAGLLAELGKLPEQLSQALAADPEIQSLSSRLQKLSHCIVIGRGYNYATAFEIALKLKELCYLSAEPFSSADFLHGPFALVDEHLRALMIAPSGAVYANVMEFAARFKKDGGRIVAISDRAEFIDFAEAGLLVPAVPEWLSPFIAVVAGQLLALELAQAKGIDFERPRGLTKVTRTV